MKKKAAVIVALVSVILTSGLFAQTYLDVPPNLTDKDYLNNVIYGDTTATGERVAADRVYRLETGGIYYYNNPIVTDGWDLKIVGADSEAEFDKAIILTGKNDQGALPPRFAAVQGDILFKNIYFSGIDVDDRAIADLTRCYKDGAIIEMDNCYVEWPRQYGACRVYSSNTSAYITNCYFKNFTSTGGPFNGKILQFEHNPVNEIIMQNNTIVNCQAPMVSVRFNTVNYFKFDHNTVVNTMKWPFHFEYWTNGEVTNNVFFNTSSFGENAADASSQDQEGQMFGVINLFPVPDSLLAQTGLTAESERMMDVRNNLFTFDQDVKDYLAKWWATDSVRQGIWMNERTQSWVDDDAGYPFLNVEAPIDEDIGFVAYATADSLIKKADQWRTDGQKTTWFWVDDDGDKVSNTTDRPHDLTYSTASASYTAADGGFPLGDLNWYPGKKTEWENYVPPVPLIAVDAEKDDFFAGLTGPDDGYIQVQAAHGTPEIGWPDDDADQSAKIWSAWDDEWFYWYAEVMDDAVLVSNAANAWRNDCIELKIDGQPTDSTETSVSFDTRLTALGPDDASGLADDMDNIDDANKQFSRKTIEGGYALEMAIKLDVLGGSEAVDAQIDDVFGLGIHIVDNDDTDRSASIVWGASQTDFVWNTPKYHGTVQFLADNKVNYIATNNMTGLTSQLPYDGNAVSGVESESVTQPLTYSLNQNYPNPFNPTTEIKYSIKESGKVRLSVYDIVGREVVRLIDGEVTAGNHKITVDASALSSGIYFYHIKSGNFTATKKMTLLK